MGQEKKLIFLASNPCSFGNTDFAGCELMIKSAIEHGHLVCRMEYLHGKVQEEMGYDIGVCLNGEICADIEEEKYIPGIYDVQVLGYKNMCKAFLWVSKYGRNRGMIVDADDENAMATAEKNYKNKEEIL